MNFNELAVAKIKCLKDTLFFTRYFFKHQNKRKFVVGRHHQLIAAALDRVYAGECKRLIINIAPRYGKTELAVKMAIAKGLALNPKAKFLHLSYSKTLALDNSETIRDLVKSPEFQQMFPGVQVKRNTDAKEKWYTTEGGGIYATGAGGQVTGFGAGIVDEEEPEDDDSEQMQEWVDKMHGFGGAIIIDDPLKPEDAEYENRREKVNTRYDTTIVNRVNSRNTPIIIIMQRVHEQDLSGHVIDNYPGWEVLSLPVINEDGSALWPFKHTVEELNELKEANEFVFDTQMMQDPKPREGLLFPRDELKHFNPNEKYEYESCISYTDVADEGDDHNSMPIGRNIGPIIYVPEWLFSQDISDITIPDSIAIHKRLKTSYWRIESNNAGAMYSRNANKMLQEEKVSTEVYPANSSTNKHTRILMSAGDIKKYCRFVDPKYQTKEYAKAYKQFTSYKKNGSSKKDDAPDSIQGLVQFIQAILSHYYE